MQRLEGMFARLEMVEGGEHGVGTKWRSGLVDRGYARSAALLNARWAVPGGSGPGGGRGGAIGTSSALTNIVAHMNLMHAQLQALELGMGQLLSRLPDGNHRGESSATPRPAAAAVAGTGVTNPDRLQDVVDSVAIVMTWVNGSDPTTAARRQKRCKEWYGAHAGHCTNTAWRLDRVRETAELLFSLRSISQNMPWFQGDIYIVISGDKPPAYLDTKNAVFHYPAEDGDGSRQAKNGAAEEHRGGGEVRRPRLHIVPQATIVPKEYQPTFNSETVKAFLHRIPGIPETFIVFDDDMMVGRPAPPSVFFTQFGGPNMFFERSRVWGCPVPAFQVWRASVCETHQVFLSRFGNAKQGIVPFHYMKHAPMVTVRSVLKQIQEEPVFQKALHESHRTPFRSGKTIQPDFMHHHLIRQTDVVDHGASFGWNADMHLIMLDGSNPPAFRDLTEEWAVKAPLFFTINDLGWKACSVGKRLHYFFKKIFPTPSPFEVANAEKFLSLGFCED